MRVSVQIGGCTIEARIAPQFFSIGSVPLGFSIRDERSDLLIRRESVQAAGTMLTGEGEATADGLTRYKGGACQIVGRDTSDFYVQSPSGEKVYLSLQRK